MPPVTHVTITGSTDVPMDTLNTLHNEVPAVGLPVVGTFWQPSVEGDNRCHFFREL